MSLVITGVPRIDVAVAEGFSMYGVATIHEAQGRTGLMASYMRPVWSGRN